VLHSGKGTLHWTSVRAQTKGEADPYLDPELYREGTAVERTNSGLDRSKTLLVRFETTAED